MEEQILLVLEERIDNFSIKKTYSDGSFFIETSLSPEVEYYGKRKIEYPSIEEQLDMMWHSMDEDETKRIEPFYSFIKSIKDKYPKPK